MNYRKLWSKQNGPIPLDEYGVSYEIHHIDGDRSNNDLSNSKAEFCPKVKSLLEFD